VAWYSEERGGASPAKFLTRISQVGLSVQFEINHDFDIPLDALELAAISPHLAHTLARRLPNVENVEVREHVLEGALLDRVWSYHANVRLPAFAKKHVTPDMTAWDETFTYDIAKHAAHWSVVPHGKPEWRKYFEASGTYVLLQMEHGKARRTVAGNLELRVPILRRTAEKLIVAEVKKMFDAEAETLRDLATLG